MKTKLFKWLDKKFDLIERRNCAYDSVLSANETGNNMSIPAFIFLMIKAFIRKKKYVFE